MKKVLIAASGLVAFYATAAIGAPVLQVQASDNGVPLVFTPTVNLPGDLNGTFADPNFSDISVNITGVPLVPSPSLGTVTLSVQGSAGGMHVLDITATQTGLTQPPGFNGAESMTFNNTIGAGGPATETFLVNGMTQATGNFAVTPVGSSAQNFNLLNLPAITSDAQNFALTFTAANQDIEATQEFTAAAVPEPGSLAILATALLMLGMTARQRRHR